MFDVSEIKTAFTGLISFEQNPDPTGILLKAPLIDSSSGMTFNSVHSMITFDNMFSSCPDYKTIHNNDSSQMLVAFNNWLVNKVEQGTINALREWITKKTNLKTAGNLLENSLLFNSSGLVSDEIISSDRTVGLEIAPIHSNNLVLQVNKIGLQLSGSDSFEIYLLASDQHSPLKTQMINYQAATGSLKWFVPSEPWILEGGKVYYIAYEQDELSTRAINGTKHFTAYSNGQIYFPKTEHYTATAFMVNESGIGADELWDMRKNQYSIGSNYGINLDVSVSCDYTKFIIDNKNLFVDIIRYRVVMDLLEVMINNPDSRVNRNEQNAAKRDIEFQLYGDTQGSRKFSIFSRYTEALNAISFDTTNIDEICLPCKDNGISISSLGFG